MPITLSIRGLYHYDSEIFSQMVEVFQQYEHLKKLDTEVIVSKIFMDAGELETLYPEPYSMRVAIGVWAKSCATNWNRLAYAESLEYNPLWNKDGTISEEGSYSDHTEGNNTGTYNDVNKVTGDNLDELVNSTGSAGSNGGTNEGESQGSNKVVRRETGNIGVTTTQQMLSEEYELRAKYNIYDTIVQSFISTLCVGVY